MSHSMLFMPRLVSSMLRQQVDLDAIAREVGIPPQAVRDPRVGMSTRQYEAMLWRIVDSCQRPAIGLELGAGIRPELFGVVGQLAMFSETLGDAFAMFARYKVVLAPERLEIDTVDGTTTVRFMPLEPDAPRSRIHADAELAFLVGFSRRMTDTPVVPTEIHLKRPRPDWSHLYRAFFECPIRFECPVDAIRFDASVLKLPLVSARPELTSVLTLIAEAQRAENLSVPLIEQQVTTIIARELPKGEPTLDQLAHRLGISSRSLQRRLSERGVSFRTLLRRTRQSLAQEYLLRHDLEPADISFLLGFNHVQSFYRAFRRWTGQTPEKFRHRAVVTQISSSR